MLIIIIPIPYSLLLIIIIIYLYSYKIIGEEEGSVDNAFLIGLKDP